MTKMKMAVSLAVMLVQFSVITGCGNSDSQESLSGNPGANDDTSKLCPAIAGTGLVRQCIVDRRYMTVGLTIDSNDDDVARNVCAEIAGRMKQLAVQFSGQWKLQIFSPYRNDKPMAACPLR